MAERTRKRVHPDHPSYEERTDYFLKQFKDAIGEMFPTPDKATTQACFSIIATHCREDPMRPRYENEFFRLTRVSGATAALAFELLHGLCLELGPSETLVIRIQRQQDIPLSVGAPVVMPRS